MKYLVRHSQKPLPPFLDSVAAVSSVWTTPNSLSGKNLLISFLSLSLSSHPCGLNRWSSEGVFRRRPMNKWPFRVNIQLMALRGLSNVRTSRRCNYFIRTVVGLCICSMGDLNKCPWLQPCRAVHWWIDCERCGAEIFCSSVATTVVLHFPQLNDIFLSVPAATI